MNFKVFYDLYSSFFNKKTNRFEQLHQIDVEGGGKLIVSTQPLSSTNQFAAELEAEILDMLATDPRTYSLTEEELNDMEQYYESFS